MKNIGLTIFFVGVVFLLGFFIYKVITEIMKEADIPVVVLIGMLGVVLGGVIMLVALIFERIKDKEQENDHHNN